MLHAATEVSTVAQVVDLLQSGFSTLELDSGGLLTVASARVRSAAESDRDIAGVVVTYLDSSSTAIGFSRYESGGVVDRWGTGWRRGALASRFSLRRVPT